MTVTIQSHVQNQTFPFLVFDTLGFFRYDKKNKRLRNKNQNEVTMKITVIDGQGGRIGKTVIEQLKAAHKDLELYAIGTNSIATSAMLKAGADYGATGENAVLVNAADSDIVIGPIGIVFANALLGEITPAIATAVGASKAYKVLIPVNRCNHFVAGCAEAPMSEYIKATVEKINSILAEHPL